MAGDCGLGTCSALDCIPHTAWRVQSQCGSGGDERETWTGEGEGAYLLAIPSYLTSHNNVGVY